MSSNRSVKQSQIMQTSELHWNVSSFSAATRDFFVSQISPHHFDNTLKPNENVTASEKHCKSLPSIYWFQI